MKLYRIAVIEMKKFNRTFCGEHIINLKIKIVLIEKNRLPSY